MVRLALARPVLFVLAAICLDFASLGAAKQISDDGIADLVAKDLAAKLHSSAAEPIAVLFRRRACKACEDFNPTWGDVGAEVARKGYKLTLVRSDASEFHANDDKEVWRRLRGVSYPAIQLFLNGVALQYPEKLDQVDAPSLAAWLDTKAKAKIQVESLTTAAAVQALKDKAAKQNMLALVSFSGKTAEAVRFAAWALDGKILAAEVSASGAELEAARRIVDPEAVAPEDAAVALLRPFRFETQTVWHESATPAPGQLLHLFDDHRRPYILFANAENEEHMFSADEVGEGIVVIFANGDDEHPRELKMLKEFAEVAVSLRAEKRTRFVWARPDAYGDAIANMMHVSMDDRPLVVIKEFGSNSDKDLVWRLQDTMGPTIDKGSIRGFVRRWLAGEAVPEDSVVTELRSDNFEKVALDTGKHVFVMLYEPNCPGCKQLFPIWTRLGRQYGKTDVVIAKMSYPDQASAISQIPKPKQFPSMLLYLKGPAGKAPVEFRGKRSQDEFVNFIEKQKRIAEDDEL